MPLLNGLPSHCVFYLVFFPFHPDIKLLGGPFKGSLQASSRKDSLSWQIFNQGGEEGMGGWQRDLWSFLLLLPSVFCSSFDIIHINFSMLSDFHVLKLLSLAFTLLCIYLLVPITILPLYSLYSQLYILDFLFYELPADLCLPAIGVIFSAAGPSNIMFLQLFLVEGFVTFRFVFFVLQHTSLTMPRMTGLKK